MPALIAGLSADAPAGTDGIRTARALVSDAAVDAVSALVNLGYRRVEAFTAVAAVARDEPGNLEVEVLIRSALRELAQTGKVA